MSPRDPSGSTRAGILSVHEPHGAERVFAEPWQAQAFALAVQLSEAGHFTWAEWTTALAAEIEAAGIGPDGAGERYYERWLATLERLVAAKGLAEPKALAARRDAWERAYRATPHGRPVELGAGKRSAR